MLLRKMKQTTCQAIIAFFVLAVAQAITPVRAEDSIRHRDLEQITVTAPILHQITLSGTQVEAEQLNVQNTGQNLPYLLSTVPGLQVTSDDGLGVGYTYFRVRGTDHTRINMTVNQVPLNDAESQTVFWVNMTDMASSVQSVDIQRGVGASTIGSASFGASLNMTTGDIDSTSHLSLSFNGGMYNTFREMVSGHLALPNNWHLNARFSKVNSDGFLYRTNSDLLSYYGDLGWYGKRTQVVARFFGGKEKTGMGWDGVSYDVAYGKNGADRRYNPAGEYTVPAADGSDSIVYYPNQTDNYQQQHAQLAINHLFTPHWSLNATLHYTHGNGYYEQYKKKKFAYWGIEGSGKTYGLYQKWLDNHCAGAILSARYIGYGVDIQFGAAANDYIGSHWGILDYTAKEPTMPLPVHYEYYRNQANKLDANGYAKCNWNIINRHHERLTLYGDLQYRYVRYQRDGINDENLEDLPLLVHYHFFNPKAGLTYINAGHQLSASFGMSNREPSRNNYKENVTYDAATATWNNLPKPETLYDYELGYQYTHSRFNIGLNLYFMDYDNQLVLTGEYNDVGAMKTTNVKDSYRAGVELTAAVRITDWIRWSGNLVLSRNRILNYKQYIDLYDNQDNWNWVGQDSIVGNTTIAFSPSVTAMSLFEFDYRGFYASVQTNVTGRQYLDNTQDVHAMLKPYTTTNLHLHYQLPINDWCGDKKGVPQIRLMCQINNLFNEKYASNGGAEASRFEDASRCVWYYAQAGINVHAGFQIDF